MWGNLSRTQARDATLLAGAERVGTLTSPLFSFGVLRRKRRNCLDWLFVSAANGKILLQAGKALHGEEVDAKAVDDLFFIYFAEEFFTDQPGGGAVAERALVTMKRTSSLMDLGDAFSRSRSS